MPKNPTVQITLSYKEAALGNKSYRLESIKHDINVRSDRNVFYPGDHLDEVEASEVATQRNVEVTTIRRK